MSITRSATLVANTWIPPSAPAGTMAALSTMPPCTAFSTTVPGHAVSSCHAAIQPTAFPSGVMETKFIEYAAATGTPQLDEGTGTTRAWPATNEGGPNGPVSPEPPWLRVSMTRQGVIAMNTNPGVVPAAAWLWSPSVWAPALGTAQFFTGIVFAWTCAKLAGVKAATAAKAAPRRNAKPSRENVARGHTEFITAVSS
jgi:hypothetical protein